MNDYIYTNGGDDRVTLRSGSDTVDLGAGTDTLALRWGNATGDMYYGPALGDLTYGSFTVFGGSEVMSVGFTGVERFDIESGSGNDAFTTGNGDDTIRSGAGNDHVSSRGGGIVIDMGAGNDAWGFDYRGSTSNITIDILNNVILGLGASSVAGVEALRSNTGDSYAYTGDGNDTVVTGTGSQIDYLQTGAGNDRVTVYNGTDWVLTGTGVGDDDVLVVDWSATAPSSGGVWIGLSGTGDGDHQVNTSPADWGSARRG